MKRRAAKTRLPKSVKERLAKHLPSNTPLTQSGHKDETSDVPTQEPNKNSATKGRSEGRPMSGAILAVSGLACCICFAIAAIYWGRGGYANVKIAFPWIIAAAVFFVGAAISAYLVLCGQTR